MRASSGSFLQLRKSFLMVLPPSPFTRFCKLGKAFGGILSTIEQDIFHAFQQIFGDLFVHFYHAGINDAHIHTGFDGMVQKGKRMHRFSYYIISSKGKADIAYPATHF
jgi:hypothetical protein